MTKNRNHRRENRAFRRGMAVVLGILGMAEAIRHRGCRSNACSSGALVPCWRWNGDIGKDTYDRLEESLDRATKRMLESAGVTLMTRTERPEHPLVKDGGKP